MPTSPHIDELPDLITRPQALRLGISKRRLYAWRDQGLITPLGRGLFMKTDTEGDPNLIELAMRAPGATLCLSSALAEHDLTDEIPTSIHTAIERGQRAPRTTAPVTWHHFDSTTYHIGRDEFEVADGLRLGIYDPMRSIIDSFRLRHREGQDIAIGALKRWLRRRGSQPSDLLDMLRHFPAAEKSIRTALEILL